MPPILDKHRLLIVTGKGGVGKTTLAAAAAVCSVKRGLKTILVTLDTRAERHPLLGVPLAYKPTGTRLGFAVSRVDAFQAATEYARRSLPFGGMYEAFFKSRSFHDFAVAAPGFEELMCLGKLYNLATESTFDRVIFDAPATGHLKDLLAVPGVTQRAVRVGPLNHNARKIEDLLLDPDRTRVLVATLAEDMPLREALETLSLCRDTLRIGAGPVLVNHRVSKRFTDPELTAGSDLAARDALSEAAVGALRAARDEADEYASQLESLKPLHAAGVAAVDIPRVVQRRYDGEALLLEVSRHLAPVFDAGAPVGAILGRDDKSLPPGGALLVGAILDRDDKSLPSGGALPVGAIFNRDLRSLPQKLDLPALVAQRRVVICCGSGGVGKTTSAAGLGLLAARAGRKVLVMTIDPARRLAQAIGLDELGHEPRRVPLDDAPGEMSALMLDSKRAFDRLVESYAPDPRVREAIFANHYYQQLSTSLGGSRELVAMERVLEAAASGDYDLLIVDTPPSQHALDFLDAPQRLVGLLDGSLTRLLVRPYGLAARAQFNLFRQSSAVALKFMERFTGVQMLADLSEFLLAFSSMFDGFKERSRKVQALMRHADTGFLLVCAPEPASLAQAAQFAARLNGDGMNIDGLLANRVHDAPPGLVPTDPATFELDLTNDDIAALAEAGDPAYSDLLLSERLVQSWQEAADLYLADQHALSGVTDGRLPLHVVPRFTHDLHSMQDLQQFVDRLSPNSR